MLWSASSEAASVPPFDFRRPLVERRRPRLFKRQALKFPDPAAVYRDAFISSTCKSAYLSANVQQPGANRRRLPIGRKVDHRLNRLMNCERVFPISIRQRVEIRHLAKE